MLFSFSLSLLYFKISKNDFLASTGNFTKFYYSSYFIKVELEDNSIKLSA